MSSSSFLFVTMKSMVGKCRHESTFCWPDTAAVQAREFEWHERHKHVLVQSYKDNQLQVHNRRFYIRSGLGSLALALFYCQSPALAWLLDLS